MAIRESIVRFTVSVGGGRSPLSFEKKTISFEEKFHLNLNHLGHY
jgi:hypothetical protein